tara:strand:- start:61 stop:297 length:237 start_codon:yes stop_codon:yes gene_type:complete
MSDVFSIMILDNETSQEIIDTQANFLTEQKCVKLLKSSKKLKLIGRKEALAFKFIIFNVQDGLFSYDESGLLAILSEN